MNIREILYEDLNNNILKKLLSSEINNETGCWEYKKNISGRYSFITVGGKNCRSHRVMFLFKNRELNSNQLVCHSCDNTKCVNPDHLFLGTQLDNMRDMVDKGRLNSFNYKKKSCIRGHLFNVENTVYYYDSKTGNKKRYCKSCEKIRDVIKIQKRKKR